MSPAEFSSAEEAPTKEILQVGANPTGTLVERGHQYLDGVPCLRIIVAAILLAQVEYHKKHLLDASSLQTWAYEIVTCRQVSDSIGAGYSAMIAAVAHEIIAHGLHSPETTPFFDGEMTLRSLMSNLPNFGYKAALLWVTWL
ncbi:hypothetical protein CO086_01775 [Candidatus Uhrbacteria bacterium CG_4_9_14_0_8_um_filter_41_16]|nr:MAG: hypothetical protein CO086_01775 [Candidatus Uhrbacteria bacterium CG_4_9_14_0_8_um_filter_41_16]